MTNSTARSDSDREGRMRAAIVKVRDDYADQMKFCDVEAHGYFREFIRRIDDALSAGPEALPDATADVDWIEAAKQFGYPPDITPGDIRYWDGGVKLAEVLQRARELAHHREGSGWQPSLGELREMLLKQASRYATKRRGCLGTNRWAREHGILQSRVSEFLSGRRPPNDDLLAALGFERRIVPMRPPPPSVSEEKES